MSNNGQFSEREKEVTEHLLQGKSNKQIALALGISASTVEYHLKNVYNKLQVNSRTEAVLRLGKSIGNIVTSELGKSTVEINSEPADNGGKSISTRRIPMNKMFYIIGGGLLTTTLVVILWLTNIPAQNTEVAPTVTFSTMTEVPTKIATGTITPIPLQTPLVVSSLSCVSASGQLPTLSNPETSLSIRHVSATLGGGVAQSKEFTFELLLYCDSAFQPDADEPFYHSDISGLAVYYNWRYDGPEQNGGVTGGLTFGFYGIDPYIQFGFGEGGGLSQGHISQGSSTGIQFALNTIPDFAQKTLTRFVFIMESPSGTLSGVALSFDIQKVTDGIQPSNIHITPLSDTELESMEAIKSLVPTSTP